MASENVKPSKKRAEGLRRFATETKAEFKKIVWPTPRQTFNKTVVVIVSIVVLGAFIAGLDALTMTALSAILKKY